jgi:ketosteroid isomerase-like protein
MSPENVEVVRRAWSVFLEGTETGNHSAIFDEGLFAPTYVLTPAREGLVAQTYVGREGFAEWFRTWTEDFSDWRMWPVKVIDAGDDRVVSIVQQSATGKASGAAVELEFGIVHTLEHGQIIDQRHYIEPREALEAVGLSDRAASQPNVEIVRDYYEAWNRAGLEGARAFWTRDFEWHDAPEMPDGAVYKGVDAVLAHFADLEGVMGTMRVEVLELEPAGEEVVATLRVRIDGVSSGLPIEGPIFEVISLDMGRVARIRLFLTASGALEAAGLSE